MELFDRLKRASKTFVKEIQSPENPSPKRDIPPVLIPGEADDALENAIAPGRKRQATPKRAIAAAKPMSPKRQNWLIGFAVFVVECIFGEGSWLLGAIGFVVAGIAAFCLLVVAAIAIVFWIIVFAEPSATSSITSNPAPPISRPAVYAPAAYQTSPPAPRPSFPPAVQPNEPSRYTPPPRNDTVHVKGYTRKDGTYVPPHTRKAPSKK